MAKKINVAELDAAKELAFAEIDEKLATLAPTSKEAKKLRKRRLKIAKKTQKMKIKASKQKSA